MMLPLPYVIDEMMFSVSKLPPFSSRCNDGHHVQTVQFQLHQTRTCLQKWSSLFLWAFINCNLVVFGVMSSSLSPCWFRTGFTVDNDTFTPKQGHLWESFTFTWCLYWADKRGTFRRLGTVPQDDPDWWRSTALSLVSFEFPMTQISSVSQACLKIHSQEAEKLPEPWHHHHLGFPTAFKDTGIFVYINFSRNFSVL